MVAVMYRERLIARLSRHGISSGYRASRTAKS